MAKHRESGVAQLPPNIRRRPARRSPRDSVRGAAAWVLERTLQAHSPVEGFLESALRPFEERDQALLRELVLGTLRWLRRLDHVLAAASDRRLADIDPVLLAPLRIAAYQLLLLDRVPAHAAVNDAVEQVGYLSHRGGTGFVNAVLRRIARAPRLLDWPVRESDSTKRLAIENSHPDFLVARWRRQFGDEATAALLAANNRPKPLQVLAFRDRGGREQLAESLIDEGLEVDPAPLSALGLTIRSGSPFSTAAFRRGDFYVQDEASQVAALLPPPRPGERILDLAAAPGGKTFALLASAPAARLVAADLSVARLLTLRTNLRRLGRQVPLLCADAAQPPVAAGWDRVLVDLPCSGTGTLRKNPELKWRLSEGEIQRLATQGRRLLAGAAPLVARGGLLVAITCSLEAEENQDSVARFLAEEPGFEPLDLAAMLPPPLARHVVGLGMWQVLAGDDHDGFTVHVLRCR
jgi:16S rRNA (cytosine967-C5)-methyltransferase